MKLQKLKSLSVGVLLLPFALVLAPIGLLVAFVGACFAWGGEVSRDVRARVSKPKERRNG